MSYFYMAEEAATRQLRSRLGCLAALCSKGLMRAALFATCSKPQQPMVGLEALDAK